MRRTFREWYGHEMAGAVREGGKVWDMATGKLLGRMSEVKQEE